MTKLERLEKALENFFTKNPKPSYESVFNAGIKFGIEMHASNNLDYESTYWKDAKEKKRQEYELKELRKDVNEKILKFLMLAVKLKIQKNSNWYVSVSSNYFSGKFDDDIVTKCGIQLTHARKESRTYDFHLSFCTFDSDNDDDTEEDKFSVDDKNKKQRISFPQWHGAHELSKDQLIELTDTLDKQYLKVLLSI